MEGEEKLVYPEPAAPHLGQPEPGYEDFLESLRL